VVTKAVISPPNGPLKKAGEKSEEDKLLADADSSSKGLFKGPFGGEMTAFVTTSLWLCFAVVFARKLCSCCCFEKTVKVKKRYDDFGQFDGRFDTDNTRKE
jgi:hypothetical protein